MPQPAKPATNIQWNAIQNGASSNSLASQLFKGKPVTKTPSVIAASSQVKSPSAPQSFPTVQPATIQKSGTTPLGTQIPQQQAPVAPAAPQNQAVVSHTVGADGSVTQKYDTGDKKTPTTASTPTPPPTATYPGIVNSLADTSQKGSPTASGLIQNTASAAKASPYQSGLLHTLEGVGAGNQAIGQSAADIAAEYGKKIADVGGQGARFEAGQLTTGTSPVAEGNAAVTAQSTAAQQQALATGEEAALQGTGQQLTAQQQQAEAVNNALGGANTQQATTVGGFNSAAGAANTAQSNVQSGLNSAGGLAAPIVGQYGQANYGIGGQGGGAIQPNDPFYQTLQSYAQQAASGQYAAIPPQITSNAVLNAQMNEMAKQINPAYNPVTSAAQSAATASNVQTAGTTPTNTAAAGYGDAVRAYSDANTAYQTASQQATNVQKILADTGINSSSSQDWNKTVNLLSSRLGAANQAKYVAGLNELKQSYTNLLSSVGASTPTVNGQQATDIFNSASTPAQIDAAISALNDAAYAKLQPMYQQAQTYQSALQGGGSSSQGQFQEGQTSSDGGLVFKGGKWVVK